MDHMAERIARNERPHTPGEGLPTVSEPRNKSERKENTRQPQLCSMPARSPGENETTLPRWYPDLPARTSREYSGRFGESPRTHIQRRREVSFDFYMGTLRRSLERRMFETSVP